MDTNAKLLEFVEAHLSACDRLIANQRAFVARLQALGYDAADAAADLAESIRIRAKIEEEKQMLLSIKGSCG